MSRAERLLALMQLLRRYRTPVSGARLAAELDVSLRTLYRDIASLQTQGATIEGEAGVGYVLRPGYLLPPLMLRDEELEALVLGTRWVSQRGDAQLAAAAREALAKIAAVLPAELRRELDAQTLLVAPAPVPAPMAVDLAQIRAAIRAEQKLRIGYQDAQGRVTQRVIWPFAIGFFEQARVVAAWCELRQELRHFRADRVAALERLDQAYPRRRHLLLREWREKEGITPDPL